MLRHIRVLRIVEQAKIRAHRRTIEAQVAVAVGRAGESVRLTKHDVGIRTRITQETEDAVVPGVGNVDVVGRGAAIHYHARAMEDLPARYAPW